MPRAAKWGLWGLGGVLGLAVIALVGLTLALGAGALTPRLLGAIEQATGRAASLGGVSLSPGLTPRLAVDGATLANLPGGSQPEMARIRRLEASLALLPLLRGEVAFRRIVIEGADILLERTAQGVPNWVLRPAATDAAPGSAAPAPQAPRAGRRVAIGEVVLTDSRLVLPDPRLGVVAVERMRVSGLGAAGPLAFEGSLALRGVALALEGEASQTEPRARGTLTAGRNRIDFEGGIGTEMRIDAALPDPAALAPLLPGLPALREASLSARVTMEGEPGRGIAVASFAIASPVLAAEGALTLTPDTPFGVTGRVAVARADLDALRPPAVASAAPPAEAPPAAALAPPAERRVIPAIALPLAAARAWQGRIEVSADEIVSGGASWRDLAAVLTARDGVLEARPLAVTTPGGVLRGQARLDARSEPPAVSLALRSEGRGLDLGALRRAMGEAPSLEGHAEIRLEIAGRGATIRAVAATLTGEAGLAMVEGRLATAGLARLGPDLVALLLPGAPRDGLALRCLALRLDAEEGAARTQALLLETASGRIEGSAAVNLRDESLAARLLPDVTLFGVTVRAPVGVGGTLAAPRFGADAGRALGQVARDTAANRLWHDPSVEWLRGRAGAHPAGDCAAQLRLARFGAEGAVPPAMPAPVPGLPRELQGTTQDLLRGLGGILGGGRR